METNYISVSYITDRIVSSYIILSLHMETSYITVMLLVHAKPVI